MSVAVRLLLPQPGTTLRLSVTFHLGGRTVLAASVTGTRYALFVISRFWEERGHGLTTRTWRRSGTRADG